MEEKDRIDTVGVYDPPNKAFSEKLGWTPGLEPEHESSIEEDLVEDLWSI